MLLYFIIITVMMSAAVGLANNRRVMISCASLFYAIQLLLAVYVAAGKMGATSLLFFTFDNTGVLFHLLLAVISPVVFFQSIKYLGSESIRENRIYHMSLMLLCASLSGVYYANNAAVTWIFLEATTLATAGLVYYRRTVKSLEATWKYIFVSSVGITIAYLGVLLLSTAATTESGLSYEMLAGEMSAANPLYMQLAFVFILAGYSCKMEVFPLYTVGIDANYAAPTPASALISTGLVNAGFVAFYRVYKLMTLTEVFPWVCNVLMLTGLLSVLIAAVYLRRTNNYKRFLAFSTVENMGIVLIALGLGEMGVFAAIFHITAHSLVKSGMFMQIAQVGKIYGTYRLNRTSDYINKYMPGGMAVVMGMVCLLALPPSGLFVSELLVMRGLIAGGRWVSLVIFVLLICLIIYSVARRFSALAFKPTGAAEAKPENADRLLTWLQITLIVAAMVLGVWQPDFLVEFINGMF